MESIERYLRLSFAHGAIKGLDARFKGAAKGKGKGARKQKAKAKAKAVVAEKTAFKPKIKDRARKNVGKRRKPSATGCVDAGFNPPRRKRPT